MKKTVYAVLFLFLSFTLSEQVHAQAVVKGTKLIGASVIIRDGFTPVGVEGEYGIQDNIGIGARFWTASNSESGYKATLSFIGAQGNYHLGSLFNLPDVADVFAGASLGLVSGKLNLGAFGSASESKFGSYLQLGGRYFFGEKFGAKLQVNVGLSNADNNSNVEIGGTFRF